MTDISESYVPKIPDGYFWKKIGESYIVFHPEKPLWTLVNQFGFECLEHFNGKNSLSNCTNIIASRYSIDPFIALQDLLQFAASLRKAGLLEDGTTTRSEKKTISLASAFLHITDACNLRCLHCYASVYRRHAGSEIHERDILNFLEGFYAQGGTALVLSGGEPLLYKNIKKFIEQNPVATIRLLTNGILLDDDFAGFIENHNVNIQVSIDGSSEKIHDSIRGSGAFQAAIAGINVLKRHGLLSKTNLSTTIMRYNINDLPNIIKLARNLGILNVRFIPLRKRGDASKNWKSLDIAAGPAECKKFFQYVFETAYSEYPDMTISSGLSGLVLKSKDLRVGNRGCSIGKNLVVDVNGNIYPCVLLMDDCYKLGNIRTSTLDELREHVVLNELVNAIYERKDKIASCRSCLWKNFCGGACLGEVHEKFGSIWRTDEYCDIRKDILEKCILRISENRHLLGQQHEGPECY